MESRMYMNENKVNTTLEISLVTLLLTVFAYLFYIFLFPIKSSVNVPDFSVSLMGWLSLLLSFYILISWYKLTGLFLTPYSIFMLFFFLFNFGQSIMWAFGIHILDEIGEAPLYGKLRVPTNADILNGQMVTLICALMFHFGAIICYKPKSLNKARLGVNTDKTLTLKAILIASIIIGFVSIPITFYSIIEALQVALTSGYQALYYSDYAENKSNFYALGEMFFLPSLIGLLIGSRYNKGIRIFVYITFFLYLIINLLSGDRGSWVYKIIILIWLSHTCYKKVNFRKVFKYVLIAFIGLYIVQAIVSIRNIGITSISVEDFINAFSFENSPIISTIFEMGGSMGIVIALLMYGWDIWPYANTYLLGFLGVLSNKIIYAFDIPFSLISSWFSQDFLGISWGAGFSMVGEAVLNYGPYIAPFIMILIGYIISSMIYIDKRMNYLEKPLFFFFTASTLHAFLPVSRGFFHLLLKNWFYGVVLYIIFIIIIKHVLLIRKV